MFFLINKIIEKTRGNEFNYKSKKYIQSSCHVDKLCWQS